MDRSARLSSRTRLRMALRLPLLLLLLLQPGAAVLVSAQETLTPGSESPREQVFAPFVSRLQAQAQG
ncbi:MAG: hypothetical protein JW820_10145, partial [Spirochaetales bacterium]|nr:hypothetical protein [Spirochaetales bacterium]